MVPISDDVKGLLLAAVGREDFLRVRLVNHCVLAARQQQNGYSRAGSLRGGRHAIDVEVSVAPHLAPEDAESEAQQPLGQAGEMIADRVGLRQGKR